MSFMQLKISDTIQTGGIFLRRFIALNAIVI